MAEWYYAINEQQAGPVTEKQLRTMLSDGEINSRTLVWKEGMDDWRPASMLVTPKAEPPPIPPRERGPYEVERPRAVKAKPFGAIPVWFQRIPLACYVVAFTCFFLPFMELSCSGERITTFSGLELAAGTSFHYEGDLQRASGIWWVYYFAAAAAAGIVLGLLPKPPRFSRIIDLAISLGAILLLVYLEQALEASLQEESADFGGLFDMKPLYAYHVSLICYITSLATGLILLVQERDDTSGPDHLSDPLEL